MSLFQLDEDHEQLRALVRQVADEQLAPRAAQVDETGSFPEESVAALIAANLHAIGLPEEFGGQGGDLLASVIVSEELARGCTTTGQVIGGNMLFAWPLLLGGTQEQKETYLPRIASGEALGAFAVSEPDAGSDVASMTTRAEAVDGGWRLKGTKRWITNAGKADLYLVLASTDPAKRSRGISAFVVEATDEGLSFGAPERKMGLRGSPTAEMYFDDMVIPRDRLVGEEGGGLRLAFGMLDRTRAMVAGQAVGIAQAALDCAIQYAKERHQFGAPIASFQGIQFMLADMATKTRAARLLAYAAATEPGLTERDLSLAGATAKCFASDTAMVVTTDAVQILGGAGYTRDFPVERLMRDAKITQIYEGTNQIQRIVIGRALLAD